MPGQSTSAANRRVTELDKIYNANDAREAGLLLEEDVSLEHGSAGIDNERISLQNNGVENGISTETAASNTAWWMTGHGTSLPLSPGGVMQLDVQERVSTALSAKNQNHTSSAGSVGEEIPDFDSPSLSLNEGSLASGQQEVNGRTMSWHGLGMHPDGATSPVCTPTTASPFPQNDRSNSPAPSYGISMAETSVLSTERPPENKRHDTHIPKSAALDVAIGRWALTGSSPHPALGQTPGSPGSVASVASARSLASIRAARQGHEANDLYDKNSSYHPLRNIHQLAAEGALSKSLVPKLEGHEFFLNSPTQALFASRTLRSTNSASSTNSSFTNFIDEERALAEHHDHGRPSRSPKYFGSKGEGEHGRRMPWENQPASIKAHVGKAKQAPRAHKVYHHKLLSSRSLREDSTLDVSGADSDMLSPSVMGESIRSMSNSVALTSPGQNLNQGTPRKAAVRSPKPTVEAKQNPATPSPKKPSVREHISSHGSPAGGSPSGSPSMTLFQIAAMKGMAQKSATKVKAKASTHQLSRHREQQHSRRMPWELQPTQVGSIVDPVRMTHHVQGGMTANK